MKKIGVILFSLTLSSFAQTFLSGELKGAFPRDNYIISSNVSVKFGDTLLFEAGSELRFKPNTGLTVRGVFIASGTAANPIILTSAQEQAAQTSGIDSQSINLWKGIDFSASKVMSRLSFCLLCFCDTALVIKNSFQKVDFDHVVFHKNKLVNIVWAGKIVETEDDIEYIYRLDVVGNSPKNDGFAIKAAEEIAYGLKSRWKFMSRSAFSTLSLAGAGVWIYGYLKANEYKRQYNLQTSTEGAIAMREGYDAKVTLMNNGIALCMIGTGAFFVTFLF